MKKVLQSSFRQTSFNPSVGIGYVERRLNTMSETPLFNNEGLLYLGLRAAKVRRKRANFIFR